MFKNFNFASANLMMFTLGIMLFSSLVMMPQFLQTLLGYTSELSGFALSAGGLVLLFEMPIMGQLTTKFQARYLIAFGWLSLSIAMFYSTKRIDLQISFSAATWLRIAQVIGLGFLFVPITLVAYIGIRPEKNNAVAGIINFMRNIGSSVGTSMVTTLIARRSQFHQEILGDHVRADSSNLQNTVAALSQQLARSGLGTHEAQMQAYARIYQTVQAQAASLAYVDTFMVLACGAAAMFLLTFILRKNDPHGGSDLAAGERDKSAIFFRIAGLRGAALSGLEMIKIVTVEREYGCGGGEIARRLAERLGWKLWDQQLTEEIARLANCPKAVVKDREERTDPLYYRLFKSFLRGSYEGSLNAHKLKLVDSESILKITERVVRHVAAPETVSLSGEGRSIFFRTSRTHCACFSMPQGKTRCGALCPAARPRKRPRNWLTPSITIA